MSVLYRVSKRCLLAGLFSLLCSLAHADLIVNYMKIADSLPEMAIKADPKAQAWARSARNIIRMTDESIAQTLIAMNTYASQKQGRPLFCLPAKQTLDANTLDGLIQATYNSSQLTSHQKQTMTVSDVALTAVLREFSCTKQGVASTKTVPSSQNSMGAYAMQEPPVHMQSVYP